MIIFDSGDKWVNEHIDIYIKDAIQEGVCEHCNNSTLCADEDGHPCDLKKPIILTVQYSEKGDTSCTGCTGCMEVSPVLCGECARMYNDTEHYVDYYRSEK